MTGHSFKVGVPPGVLLAFQLEPTAQFRPLRPNGDRDGTIFVTGLVPSPRTHWPAEWDDSSYANAYALKNLRVEPFRFKTCTVPDDFERWMAGQVERARNEGWCLPSHQPTEEDRACMILRWLVMGYDRHANADNFGGIGQWPVWSHSSRNLDYARCMPINFTYGTRLEFFQTHPDRECKDMQKCTWPGTRPWVPPLDTVSEEPSEEPTEREKPNEKADAVPKGPSDVPTEKPTPPLSEPKPGSSPERPSSATVPPPPPPVPKAATKAASSAPPVTVPKTASQPPPQFVPLSGLFHDPNPASARPPAGPPPTRTKPPEPWGPPPPPAQAPGTSMGPGKVPNLGGVPIAGPAELRAGSRKQAAPPLLAEDDVRRQMIDLAKVTRQRREAYTQGQFMARLPESLRKWKPTGMAKPKAFSPPESNPTKEAHRQRQMCLGEDVAGTMRSFRNPNALMFSQGMCNRVAQLDVQSVSVVQVAYTVADDLRLEGLCNKLEDGSWAEYGRFFSHGRLLDSRACKEKVLGRLLSNSQDVINAIEWGWFGRDFEICKSPDWTSVGTEDPNGYILLTPVRPPTEMHPDDREFEELDPNALEDRFEEEVGSVLSAMPPGSYVTQRDAVGRPFGGDVSVVDRMSCTGSDFMVGDSASNVAFEDLPSPRVALQPMEHTSTQTEPEMDKLRQALLDIASYWPREGSSEYDRHVARQGLTMVVQDVGFRLLERNGECASCKQYERSMHHMMALTWCLHPSPPWVTSWDTESYEAYCELHSLRFSEVEVPEVSEVEPPEPPAKMRRVDAVEDASADVVQGESVEDVGSAVEEDGDTDMDKRECASTVAAEKPTAEPTSSVREIGLVREASAVDVGLGDDRAVLVADGDVASVAGSTTSTVLSTYIDGRELVRRRITQWERRAK